MSAFVLRRAPAAVLIAALATARASLAETDTAEGTPDRASRMPRLVRAVDAARLAVASDPGSARAHYALGAALGVRLDTDRAGGLAGVKTVRDEFQRAADLDPAF